MSCQLIRYTPKHFNKLIYKVQLSCYLHNLTTLARDLGIFSTQWLCVITLFLQLNEKFLITSSLCSSRCSKQIEIPFIARPPSLFSVTIYGVAMYTRINKMLYAPDPLTMH